MRRPTPPKHRCRVVVCPTYKFNVVQVLPNGRHVGICKSYFYQSTGRKKWEKKLTWLDAVRICARANVDRMDNIFGVRRSEVAA